VVTASHDTPVNSSWLEEYLNKMEECDVYRRRHFLEGVILTNFQRGRSVAADFHDYLKTVGNKWLDVRHEKDLAERLAPGPYLYYNKTLKPICRLYDDKQRAFLTTLKPQSVW
jgi:hypothetical protein